jgi:hypothetical protein
MPGGYLVSGSQARAVKVLFIGLFIRDNRKTSDRKAKLGGEMTYLYLPFSVMY